MGSLKDMFQSSCKLNHCVLLFLELDFCGSDWIQNFSSIDLCKDVDSLISFSCCRLYSSSKYLFFVPEFPYVYWIVAVADISTPPPLD